MCFYYQLSATAQELQNRFNAKLENGGLFIDWVETYGMRKNRLLQKYAWGLNYLVYSLDFILVHMPKLTTFNPIRESSRY